MILGTAGHVDHGKTALVKALTGVDTDRLPEEKRRGITLELGFAQLTLPDGRRLGVIDVPGHERFVKAMAAGAGGIDLALLVVAADEGLMPQTREHLDILRLLGVRAGLWVVTKADLLPGLGEGWLDLLEADLRTAAAGTFLEKAPLLAVSARTGEGLDALKAAIARLASSEVLEARPSDAPLFLPIDRAFTVKGFGCVVTGTLLSGRVAPEEEVLLVPSSLGPVRVRGVQVHGAAVPVATAGDRVALNLAGLEVTTVQRGMAVVRAQELPEARVLDVELELLPAALGPLPRRTRALVALGTAQVETQVRLIEVDALRPGETAFAQLRLSATVAALPGQRFILRGTRALPGRGATLGGGRVLSVNPPRRRRAAAGTLRALASSGLDERVTLLLKEAGYAGLTEKALFARASASAKELARTLAALSSAGKVALVDKDERRYLAEDVRRALAARAVVLLDTYYSAHPDADAMPRQELKSRLGVPHERTFQRLLTSLADAGQAQVSEDLVKLPGRGRTVTQAGQAARAQVARKLAEAALQPPTAPELARTLSLPPAAVETALAAMVADGAAVRAGELTFDAAAVQSLQARLVAFLEEKGSISTQAFKDLVGLSRKYVIPLAEYFDAHKVTLRVGENRTLRRGASER